MAFFFSLLIILVYIIDKIETFLKWLDAEYIKRHNNYNRKRKRKKKTYQNRQLGDD